MAKDKFGLKELPRDDRDFQLGALFYLPELEELPEEFSLGTVSIKNQRNTDFCSAYASCGVSELQEGVELYPEYSFASSKVISGDPDEWGQDLRSAMKAHVEYGALPELDVPNEIKDLSDSDKRRFEYYKGLLDKALPQRKKSYFAVKGQYDAFDNIRASIWKFREQKQAVEIGVIFGWSLKDYVLNTVSDSGYGHAMYVIGWNKDGLLVVNSYGREAGKDGIHVITREVINAFIPRFGAYMFIDIDPERAKELLTRRKLTIGKFWDKVKVYLSSWWKEIWL